MRNPPCSCGGSASPCLLLLQQRNQAEGLKNWPDPILPQCELKNIAGNPQLLSEILLSRGWDRLCRPACALHLCPASFIFGESPPCSLLCSARAAELAHPCQNGLPHRPAPHSPAHGTPCPDTPEEPPRSPGGEQLTQGADRVTGQLLYHVYSLPAAYPVLGGFLEAGAHVAPSLPYKHAGCAESRSPHVTVANLIPPPPPPGCTLIAPGSSTGLAPSLFIADSFPRLAFPSLNSKQKG